MLATKFVTIKKVVPMSWQVLWWREKERENRTTKYYNVLPGTYSGLNLYEALLSQGCPNAFSSYATEEWVDFSYILYALLVISKSGFISWHIKLKAYVCSKFHNTKDLVTVKVPVP